MSEAALEPLQMPSVFDKSSKGTKSKSFARRAIGFLPTVAKGALGVANAANSMGFVQNPALKSLLRGANLARTIAPAVQGVARAVSQRHSLRY